MGVFTVNASMKGQVTVPSEVRKIIGLEPGGKLQFRVADDGTVTVIAKRRGIAHLRGIFETPENPIDIDAEIEAEVWERNRPGSNRSS